MELLRNWWASGVKGQLLNWENIGKMVFARQHITPFVQLHHFSGMFYIFLYFEKKMCKYMKKECNSLCLPVFVPQIEPITLFVGLVTVNVSGQTPLAGASDKTNVWKSNLRTQMSRGKNVTFCV